MTSTTLVAFRKQNGMTLIELVIGVIVLSIVAVSVTAYAATSMRIFIASKDNINALSKINYSMERLAKEIRKVNYLGATTMSPTTFEFTNTDGATITLNYDGAGQLVEITDSSISATNYTLVDQVTSFVFAYYDGTGTGTTTDPAALEFVEFSLTKQEGSVSYSNRKRVMLRDLQ